MAGGLGRPRTLAAALNNLLASPTFASWCQGATLDIADWLTPRNERAPIVILSVAHLDDDYRALSNAALSCLGRLQTGSAEESRQRGVNGARTHQDDGTPL